MVLPINGVREPVTIVDTAGNAAALIFDGAVWRLAVDATVILPPMGSVAINDAGAGTTELSVKVDGTAIPGTDGSALVGGRDPLGDQRAIAVDAVGAVIVSGTGAAPLNTVTFAAPTFATVGVASALVVAANAARKALILTVTLAGRRVSLGFGAAPAVLDSGITIVTAQPLVLDSSMLSTQAVNAIANAAATNLAIQEGS